jgi:hypothetical protein
VAESPTQKKFARLIVGTSGPLRNSQPPLSLGGRTALDAS